MPFVLQCNFAGGTQKSGGNTSHQRRKQYRENVLSRKSTAKHILELTIVVSMALLLLLHALFFIFIDMEYRSLSVSAFFYTISYFCFCFLLFTLSTMQLPFRMFTITLRSPVTAPI